MKRPAARSGLPDSHPGVPMKGNGSGVAFKKVGTSGTYILTNNHVVENATKITVADAVRQDLHRHPGRQRPRHRHRRGAHRRGSPDHRGRRLDEAAGRPDRRGDRLAVRLRALGDVRSRLGARALAVQRRRAAPTPATRWPTSSRPTRRSTPATPAARWSTGPASSSASTPRSTATPARTAESGSRSPSPPRLASPTNSSPAARSATPSSALSARPSTLMSPRRRSCRSPRARLSTASPRATVPRRPA